MKRMNMTKVMDETVMAMISDADNTTVYDMNQMQLVKGEYQNHVFDTTFRMNIESTKEDKDENLNKILTLMTEMNKAFNRSVGAPESMKLFKVENATARWAGNNTVAVEINMATLATGTESMIDVLLNGKNMMMNIWKTNACVFESKSTLSEETHGLGNALRSWKAIMRKYGVENNMAEMAILYAMVR